jgi:hypothetical protein
LLKDRLLHSDSLVSLFHSSWFQDSWQSYTTVHVIQVQGLSTHYFCTTQNQTKT